MDADKFPNGKHRGNKSMTAHYHHNRTEWTFKTPWVRTLTVFIYLLCVSLSAIILGVYYLFFWDPCVGKCRQFGNNM